MDRNIVLVVDDDPRVLKGVQRLLRAHAYEPILFSSSEAFKNHTDFETAACVILDRSRYQVGQLVGARNSRPAPEVVKVVGTFVEEINNRVHVATMVGAVD